MGDTKITYLQGVWNPFEGCSPISEGCLNCYALGRLHRFGHPTRPTLHPERLDEWLKRKGRIVGVGFQSDWLNDAIPIEFLAEVGRRMTLAPQHAYLLLTKRTARLAPVLRDLRVEFGVDLGAMDNVWFGATVESKARAYRACELMSAPVSHRWLSIEPQVEAVDPDQFLHRCPDDAECHGCGGPLEECRTKAPAAIEWIAQGCESGARRRPFDLAWARTVRDACSRWGTPYYLKQAPGCGNDDCHCWDPGGECSRPEDHPCEDRLERATVVSMPTLDGSQHAGIPRAWLPFVPPGRTPLDAWREVKALRRQRSASKGGAG